MKRLIKNLKEQLDCINEEYSIEVNNDTYWRGVKITLETYIELAEELAEERVITESQFHEGTIFYKWDCKHCGCGIGYWGQVLEWIKGSNLSWHKCSK